MRVVVNNLVALGRKTGIGHYIAQLLRCLREQAGDDAIDVLPGQSGAHRDGRQGRCRACEQVAGGYSDAALAEVEREHNLGAAHGAVRLGMARIVGEVMDVDTE